MSFYFHDIPQPLVGTGMGAHIDDAEPAILQPILSLSLGASCVFLIGTADRTEQPTAIYLRSGIVSHSLL